MSTRTNPAFYHHDAFPGVLLFACAVVALILANTPVAQAYHNFWHLNLVGLSLQHWVNDGLMAIFFFLVGLEIKRELLEGELSSMRKASLPIAAAIGGMIVPAALYYYFNPSPPNSSGWGIPMATDIAFAIGVLTLFGSRIAPSVKVFLTALAIVDDLGAVLVIAFFYTAEIAAIYLFIGIGVLAILYILNRMQVLNLAIYLVSGVLVWFVFLKSGIHATIAGVLLALVLPMTLVHKLEHILKPWVALAIMPIFALANAGVSVDARSIEVALQDPVGLGIIAGLVIGKQFGITIFSWLAVKSRLAILPSGMSWGSLYGVAWLGGIGFTMSLFIANLAFTDAATIEVAKLGILMASLMAGVIGSVVLAVALKTATRR